MALELNLLTASRSCLYKFDLCMINVICMVAVVDILVVVVTRLIECLSYQDLDVKSSGRRDRRVA